MAKAAKRDPLDELEDAAVDDLLAAVKAGDRGAAKSALRDFVKVCLDRYEATESEDE